MSYTENIAAYLREKKANNLRDNIVKTNQIHHDLGIKKNTVGTILKEMRKGNVDGVDLSIWQDTNGSGGIKYKIEHVADDVSGHVVVDDELCGRIRRMLKANENSIKEIAAEINVSKTQVSNHGRGCCTHVIAEPPAESRQHGSHYEWIEVNESP